MYDPQRPYRRPWTRPAEARPCDARAVPRTALPGAASSVAGPAVILPECESAANEAASEDCGEDSYTGSGRLTGRIALVTGGDRGIGRAVAIAFAREGADVAIAYYDGHADARRTAEAVRAAGRRASAISGDLASPEHCRSVVARVVAQLGRLDILVNVASHRQSRDSLLRISPHELERTFRTNLFATIWLTQASLEHMQPGSVIINTGSVAAMEGDAALIDYAASQGAVHALTRCLGRSLLQRGVRVNCLATGGMPEDDDTAPAASGDGTPARFAAAYVHLASDAGRRWNGSVLTPAALDGVTN